MTHAGCDPGLWVRDSGRLDLPTPKLVRDSGRLDLNPKTSS